MKISDLSYVNLDVSDHHCIKPLSLDPEMKQFFSQLHIPTQIMEELYLFTIPSYKDNLYRLHYGYLQEENPYRPIPFSYDDWLIAYLAAENLWGVLSYDHHLLYKIQKYLDFEGYLPDDIQNLPAHSMILIDTNILLHFLDRKYEKKNSIEQMFQDNPSITFMVSENILRELGRVYSKKFGINEKKRKFVPITMHQKIYNQKEPCEEDIRAYVEDFGRFESGKQRRIRKKKKYQKHHKCVRNVESKWAKFL
jgi:rRNA-processing protein FCF1